MSCITLCESMKTLQYYNFKSVNDDIAILTLSQSNNDIAILTLSESMMPLQYMY